MPAVLSMKNPYMDDKRGRKVSGGVIISAM